MNKNELKEKDVKIAEKEKKIPKEVSQEILNKIFSNLLKGIMIMLYFITLNMAYSAMKQERLVEDIKVFAGTYLFVGIIMLEKAYKNEKFETSLTGVELFCLSIHSLTIMHVTTLFKYDFRYYLLTSSYIFSIYFVLKSIVLYTKGKREYLKSFSDISEIVKKEQPIKKEAKKKTDTDQKAKETPKEQVKEEKTAKKSKKKATKSGEKSRKRNVKSDKTKVKPKEEKRKKQIKKQLNEKEVKQ